MISIQKPETLPEFLLKCNGAHLFCSDAAEYAETAIWWSDSGVVVFGIEALLAHRQELQWIYEPYDSPETPFPVPIAYLGRICTSDFCALKMDELTNFENPVMYCQHDFPSDWKESIVASSFEDWLQKMFDNVIKQRRFPEYWFKDNLYDNSIAQLSEE